MSRSYTNCAMKGFSSNKDCKKISNRKFRHNSKKDPENVTNPKIQGLNRYAFYRGGRYIGDWDSKDVKYKHYCK